MSANSGKKSKRQPKTSPKRKAESNLKVVKTKSSEFKTGSLHSLNKTGKSFKSNKEPKENVKTDALINLNSAGDSFSEKEEKVPKLKKANSRSRLVMLPHGVIEDTKGEDNASEDAANLKRRNSKINKDKQDGIDYDIDKNSYFRDSFDGGSPSRRSDKDIFNSSLGGWDVEETRKKKPRP